MLNKAPWLLFAALFTVLMPVTRLCSQNITKSPYSIVGVGDLVFSGNIANYTLGQVSQGRRDMYAINALNPASYSGLQLTNIEAGAVYSFGHFASAGNSNDVTNAWIGYLNFAFPLSPKRGMGLSFGATPYSGVGYNIQSATIVQHDSASIPATYSFMGNGGLSRFYFGYGMRAFTRKTQAYYNDTFFHLGAHLPAISLGFNGNYLFGQIRNTTQLLFPAQYYLFNTNEDKISYVHGLNYDLGIQLHDTFATQNTRNEASTRHEWCVGLTYTPQASVGVDQSYILRTLPIGGSTGIRDTVYANDNVSGTMIIPMSWKAGFSYGQTTSRKNRSGQRIMQAWQIAGDVRAMQWSAFRNIGANDSLRNSIGYSVGASYVPDITDNANILRRIEYRAGFRYEQSNLSVNGTGVDLRAFTAGFGVPLPKSHSKLNLGVEYMTRGTVNNGLIREEYFRIILGISFSDKWFYQYRYD